ncbi:MAG TPA: glycosyltransferase family 39 protein, partial [bacterium]|nr:glycosyltransferase family 39 protein [bacterium]
MIAIILLTGLALRLGAFFLIEPSSTSYDESKYYSRAAALAAGRLDMLGDRKAPASMWYYAGAFRVFGTHPNVARLANVVAGALLPWIVWRLGRRFAGRRAGLLAALGAAVYPNLVFFGASILSEGLYVPLAVGALAATAAARDDRRPRTAALAGMLLGAATLTREVAALFVPLAAIWLLTGKGVRPARWLGAALFVAGFAVVVAPWSIRQSQRVGSFVFVSQTTGENLLVGNVHAAPKRVSEPTDGPAKEARPAVPDYRTYRSLGKTTAEREAAA